MAFGLGFCLGLRVTRVLYVSRAFVLFGTNERLYLTIDYELEVVLDGMNLRV